MVDLEVDHGDPDVPLDLQRVRLGVGDPVDVFAVVVAIHGNLSIHIRIVIKGGPKSKGWRKEKPLPDAKSHTDEAHHEGGRTRENFQAEGLTGAEREAPTGQALLFAPLLPLPCVADDPASVETRTDLKGHVRRVGLRTADKTHTESDG